jgi:hypothetical protein
LLYILAKALVKAAFALVFLEVLFVYKFSVLIFLLYVFLKAIIFFLVNIIVGSLVTRGTARNIVICYLRYCWWLIVRVKE